MAHLTREGVLRSGEVSPEFRRVVTMSSNFAVFNRFLRVNISISLCASSCDCIGCSILVGMSTIPNAPRLSKHAPSNLTPVISVQELLL